MQQLVTAKELARSYGVTAQTILAWHRRRWIPAVKAGKRVILFDPSEVERALKIAAVREGGDDE